MQIERATFVGVFTAALLASVLTGCSQKHTEQPNEQAQAQSTEKPGGVIPQAQLDALNKAKNIENVLKQNDQQRREQSEAAQ